MTLLTQKHTRSALLFFLLFLILSGCAKTSLTVQVPAEISTQDIRNVAVGTFEIGSIQEQFKTERKGVWVNREVSLSQAQKDSISRAVRARVINLLTEVPYFNVVFSDEFQKLENDTALQELVSVKGYKTPNLDAVLSGKIWVDVQRTDGVELEKVALDYFEGPSRRSQGSNLTVEQLVWWPYKQTRGTLALEIKMTRLPSGNVVALSFDQRNYAHKIGGKPANLQKQLSEGLAVASDYLASSSSSAKKNVETQVLPSFDQMIADMALSIAARFVQKVAVTEKTVSYPIAEGGNPNAKVLMEAGAYNLAIEMLQKSTANNPGEQDLYNLALCFESKGDYGLALNFYREAFDKNPSVLMYAQGIGRLERLKREFPQLKRQLQTKKL